jgi:hypothetical protein
MLGRLEQVPLRSAWVSEAQDFTRWLAEEDNLALLSEALEMDLVVEAVERHVGSYRADILCRDQSDDHVDDHLVLIENQLERTDHTHLGQLLTYAAGLQTVTIVWIAAQFSEQHRAALDWLNEITDERFRFFGLEVELWRIGDSPVAPKFNIVSKPNDWSKTMARRTASAGSPAGGHSDLRQAQIAFWNEIASRMAQSNCKLKGRTPRAQSWYPMAIGRSGFNLHALFVAQKSKIGVELYFSGATAHRAFDAIMEDKGTICAVLGSDLEWIKASKEARIALYREITDPLDSDRWPEWIDWIIEKLAAFDDVFRQRVKGLPDFK